VYVDIYNRVYIDLVDVSINDTATHCNTLQHTPTHSNTPHRSGGYKHEQHCNTLQHTPTHSNTLQHTPTHSNTLQHIYKYILYASVCVPIHFFYVYMCMYINTYVHIYVPSPLSLFFPPISFLSSLSRVRARTHVLSPSLYDV